MDLFVLCHEDPDELKKRVNEGAHVNMKNVFGSTLLHWAAACKQPSLVEFLIQKGIHVNTKNTYGTTPLHWARTREVIETLLKHGADIDAVNTQADTPLEFVCIEGYTEAIRGLYEYGSRVPNKRYKELDKVIALYASMCWKRSDVGGLPSTVLVTYLV
jgi:ankyrin repeat protein